MTTVDAVLRVGQKLDHYAGVCIILGVFVLFGGNGILSIGGYSIELARYAPASIGTIATMIGAVLILAPLYVLLVKWLGYPAQRRFLNCVFIILLVYSLAYITYSSFFSRPGNPVHEWGYSLSQNRFWMEVAANELRRHEGRSLVLVVKSPGSETGIGPHVTWVRNDSWQVSQGAFRFSVDNVSIKNDVRLGDRIQGFLYSIPRDASLEEARTLSDIQDVGGQQLAYRWATVSIRSYSFDEWENALNSMPSSLSSELEAYLKNYGRDVDSARDLAP
ncbi:hypothetical protein ACERK3_17335 [Phycisphaerales bacterium AB-hyl4]|uniref:Uncharacterized protein n=1 Tax=Natronomicrosphaera hydrolytica TaxID=3242702 RepID=A0ABV4U8W8_9BACT